MSLPSQWGTVLPARRSADAPGAACASRDGVTGSARSSRREATRGIRSTCAPAQSTAEFLGSEAGPQVWPLLEAQPCQTPQSAYSYQAEGCGSATPCDACEDARSR